VSNIEPGLCGDTEFSKVRFKGDLQKEKQPYENIHYLTPQDIADIVLFIYEAPSHVNINSLEVMPVAQTFAGLITYPQQE
jgi:3-hydroxy acid dehydrogenase / malonic semialdehyde reductase